MTAAVFAGGRAGQAADARPRGGTFGFFLMVLGMFMAILDIQIVASSLPQIQAGISASADEITWVQTAYLIAEVVMIPLSGWLARVMSTRWLFAASSAGFTLMSLACALAWDTPSMITFRALQGFLGGAMIPTVYAANFKLFPPGRQIIGTVVIGMTATMAPAIGPTLGGYLTETFSWHWLFLANVFPGILITIAVPLIVNIDRPNWRLVAKIDILGILLIAGFLGSLEFVLDEGSRNDWFESRQIVVFAAISAVSGVALIWRQLVIENPVLELHAFKNRNFTVGCILTFVLGMCLYGQSYILPQVLGRVRGFNSLQVGQVMYVTGLAMFLTAPLAARIGGKLDPRLVLAIGFAVVSAGLYLNSRMTVDVGFDQLMWPQILRGIGLVSSIVTITTVALGTLPRDLVGGASGLFNLFRNMGGAMGLAMINTQWDGRYDRHYWWLAEGMRNTDPAVAARVDALTDRFSEVTTLGGDAQSAALNVMVKGLSQQASILAWDDVFLMMSIAFLAATPLLLLLAKPQAKKIDTH